MYGNIYSDTYESVGDGGPTCYYELTNTFRFSLSAISVFINSILVFVLYKKIKKSRELDLSLVKNLNPNWIEKLIGYSSYFTLIVMIFYKLYTGRGVYMLNPCHMCLLQ